MDKTRDDDHGHRFLGVYSVPNSLVDGLAEVGELYLDGRNTVLRIHTERHVEFGGGNSLAVTGQAYSNERITLADCNWSTTQLGTSPEFEPRYTIKVFPHYVIVGSKHLALDKPEVKVIRFSTSDLADLFYDADAFGFERNANSIIDSVLERRRQTRPCEVGERPMVFYFSGRTDLCKVSTTIGNISINRLPIGNYGPSSGFKMVDHVFVTIEPSEPKVFEQAVELVHEMASFLSMAAGRLQEVRHIQVSTSSLNEEGMEFLAVHPTFPWGADSVTDEHKPHPSDIPFDAIKHSGEFASVLKGWFSRQASWRIARFAYIGCIGAGNVYNPGRLTAAANLFDLLPSDEDGNVVQLPGDLKKAVEEFKAELKKNFPQSDERDLILNYLGKVERPTLRSKVAKRISIINSKFEDQFTDLELVTKIAVQCRNYFVHGYQKGFDFEKAEPYLSFMTEALEFLFLASDLIELGWDAKRWNSEPHSLGHSFSRFRFMFEHEVKSFRLVFGEKSH